MVCYNSTSVCLITQEKKSPEDFFNSFLTNIYSSLQSKYVSDDLLKKLIPNSESCMMTWSTDPDATTFKAVHRHTRRHHRCMGCLHMSWWIGDMESTDSKFCISISDDKCFDIVRTVGVSLSAYASGTAIMPMSGWAHNVIGRVLFHHLNLSVRPIQFAFVCQQSGIAVNPQFPESLPKVDALVSQLATVSGFINHAHSDLIDASGLLSNLSTVHWSTPSGVRWVAPDTHSFLVMPTFITPKIKWRIDGWRGTTNVELTKKWNRWMILISLYFSEKHKTYVEDTVSEGILSTWENVESAETWLWQEMNL